MNAPPCRTLAALALLAGLAHADPEQTLAFPLPTQNLAIFGVQFSADFLGPATGTIEGASVQLDYTTTTLDAADLVITFQAPSVGVPVWQFTGADLGWAGTGTFDATMSTDALDGPIDLGFPPPDFSLFLIQLTAVGFQPLGGQFTASAFTVDWDPWTDLGNGLAGSGGLVPALNGVGTMAGGTSVDIVLTDALPSSSTNLFVGFAPLGAPLKGGVLVPTPDLLIAGLPTGPLGELTLSTVLPPAVPSGASLFLQHWVVDPGGPKGLAASHGVTVTTP